MDAADRASSVRRHPQVAELLADGQPAPAAIDDFLANHEFPLVEPGAADLRLAGRGRPCRSPALDPWRRRPRPFEQLPGTDLWLLRLPVEDGGRFEYKLAIGRHGGEDLDPRSAQPGAGGRSLRREFGVPHLGYARPEWSEPRGAPAGRIESRGGREPRLRRGAARSGSTCRPAIDPGRPYPLVIIHDGEDFVTYADLPVVARQPDRRGRHPTGDRGAGADPRPAGRIFRRAQACALPRRGSSCRRSQSRYADLGGARGPGAARARASARWPRSSTAFRYPGRLWRAGAEVRAPSSSTSASWSTGRIRSSTASRG